MVMPGHESPAFESTYYREYGLHDTGLKDLSGGPVSIASAPEWSEMYTILKSVTHGTVVTNDYATSSVDISEAPVDINEVEERIMAVRYLSLDSVATFHLGTAHRAENKKIYLGALSIRWGEIIGTTYKAELYPVEERGGLTSAATHREDHVRKDGSALVICSDLLRVEHFLTDKEKMRAQRLFALTEWAYSDIGDESGAPVDSRKKMLEIAVAKAGGLDNYHRNNMEYAVGKLALPQLPHVRSVIVADKGRPDLPPYNAVFRRAA